AYELKSKFAGNCALKTIVIEPLVAFSKPVQLTLGYDGCLANGTEVCEAESIIFLIWDDEAAYINLRAPKVCSNCNVNSDAHTICMSICQTGVIATIAEW
ncbi:MAG: hypothetical protein L0Y37_03100, partial [Bacteroidales bacterium]|nr:hypothetical protein [Bacteroidales bacterium]